MDGLTTRPDIPSVTENHVLFGMRCQVLWTRERTQAAIRRVNDDPTPHGGLIYKSVNKAGVTTWHLFSLGSVPGYPNWKDAAEMAMRHSIKNDERLTPAVVDWFNTDKPEGQSGLDF